MKIANFSTRCIVIGTMIVFVYAGVTGILAPDAVENIFMFVAGCVLGRGRQPLMEEKEKV